MKGHGIILSLLVLCAATAGAFADVSAVPWAEPQCAAQGLAGGAIPDRAAGAEGAQDPATCAMLGGPMAAGSLPTPDADEPAPAVISSPSRSGSASLLLCAFGSMCAWRVTQSARKLHLGLVPEWYHTGGPSQIGQAVPAGLDFAALPVAHFDQPAGQSPLLWRLPRISHSRCQPQWHPTTGAPRAPPHLL